MTGRAEQAPGVDDGLSVWLLDLGDATEEDLDLALLSADELARAQRFRQVRDRIRYAVAHAALRLLLGARLSVESSRLVFRREPCPLCGDPHGRPALAGHARAPHFSLSHGGDLAAIAVAPVPVGIDVEAHPTAEGMAETSALLHPAEQAELAAAAPEYRRAAFARLWVRKEAYLKALGTGLGRALTADYLGEDGRAPAPAGWTVACLETIAGHAAGYAVREDAAQPPAVHRAAVGGAHGVRISRLAVGAARR